MMLSVFLALILSYARSLMCRIWFWALLSFELAIEYVNEAGRVKKEKEEKEKSTSDQKPAEENGVQQAMAAPVGAR